jgi:hypothetical protein
MTFPKPVNLTRPQRIVVAIYFLSLAYCCLWIPWRVEIAHSYTSSVRFWEVVYGWLWKEPAVVYYSPLNYMPDLPLIFLRCATVTAIALAVFVLAGMPWKASTTR